MLRYWGHVRVRRSFYEAAARAFTRALDFAPDSVEVYLARGLIYWRELHDFPHAIADFSSVLKLAPARSEALFYRGMAHQGQSDYAAAAADLRAALTQAPHAIWSRNAYHQLTTIEAILEEMPSQLTDGADGLIPKNIP